MDNLNKDFKVAKIIHNVFWVVAFVVSVLSALMAITAFTQGELIEVSFAFTIVSLLFLLVSLRSGDAKRRMIKEYNRISKGSGGA